MRCIQLWNITARVRENIANSKSSVELGDFRDPRVLSVLTVGRDHHHLQPGHYVIVDTALDGPFNPVCIRLTPVLAEYRENASVQSTLLGVLSDSRDAVPCLVFHLTCRLEDVTQMSWRQQDAANS